MLCFSQNVCALQSGSRGYQPPTQSRSQASSRRPFQDPFAEPESSGASTGSATRPGGNYDSALAPIKIPFQPSRGDRGVQPSSFNRTAPSRFPEGHFDSPLNWGDVTGPILPPARWLNNGSNVASNRFAENTSSGASEGSGTSRSGAAGRTPSTSASGKGSGTRGSNLAVQRQQEGFTPRTVDQNLVYAVQLATDGKVRRAESLATKAFEQEDGDVGLAIRYIETMVTIAEFADKKSSPLNRAIKVAGRIEKSKLANGKGNAELAFKFLKALNVLGESVTDLYPKQGSKLLIAEGNIASNLMENDGFPAEARP